MSELLKAHIKNKESSQKLQHNQTQKNSHNSHPAHLIQRAHAAPHSLSPADVMQLQRAIGNQAVGRLLAEIGRLPSGAQEAVQRQPEEEEELQMKPVVQRQELEEEEPLQCKFTDECIQCQIPEDEELMQGKGLTLRAKEEAPPNRTGMPDHLKSGLETLSGMALDDVKVHYNSDKPARLHALAYTQGTDIHVAPGQERHLPHEGWHAVQQKQGRVQPTGEVGRMPLNDSRTLESEADSMGHKALQQYTQVEKLKEDKSRAVANSVGQKKDNFQLSSGFVDNRSEYIVQSVQRIYDVIKDLNKYQQQIFERMINATYVSRITSQEEKAEILRIRGLVPSRNIKGGFDEAKKWVTMGEAPKLAHKCKGQNVVIKFILNKNLYNWAKDNEYPIYDEATDESIGKTDKARDKYQKLTVKSNGSEIGNLGIGANLIPDFNNTMISKIEFIENKRKKKS